MDQRGRIANGREPMKWTNDSGRAVTLAGACGGLLVLLAAAGASQAALVGNDPNEAGFDHGSDGHNVLSIQLQNPITQSGVVDSFSYFSGTLPPGTPPFELHAYVFRPTGNANEYSIVFDSGAITAPADNTVHTQPITPVTVQPGDVIGHHGRGVGFDIDTTGEDTWFYNGSEFATPAPTGTFTAPGPNYTLGGAGSREYALAFNFEVPEPTALGLSGVAGLALLRRRRRSDR